LSGLGQGEGLPLTIAFDPALPYQEQTGFNQGCPPGYFAQFVETGEADSSQPASVGIVPGGSTAIRCRLKSGYTAQINAEETGQAASESWYQATHALGQPGEWLPSSTGLLAGFGPLALLGVAAIALLALVRR
jgi:hypothetical protein